MKLPTSRLVLAVLLLAVQSDLVTSTRQSRDDDQWAHSEELVESAADFDVDVLEQKRLPVLTIDRQNHQRLRENLLEIIRRRQQAVSATTPETPAERTTRSHSTAKSRFDRTRTTTTAAPTTSEPAAKKLGGGKLAAAGHPSADRIGRPRLFAFF